MSYRVAMIVARRDDSTLDWPRAQKTPEINVSDRDKTTLKIWAHNFEK